MSEAVKPISAYLFYASHRRPELKKKFPNVSFGEFTNIIRGEWSLMSKNEKKPFKDMHKMDKKRFKNICYLVIYEEFNFTYDSNDDDDDKDNKTGQEEKEEVKQEVKQEVEQERYKLFKTLKKAQKYVENLNKIADDGFNNSTFEHKIVELTLH